MSELECIIKRYRQLPLDLRLMMWDYIPCYAITTDKGTKLYPLNDRPGSNLVYCTDCNRLMESPIKFGMIRWEDRYGRCDVCNVYRLQQ